MCENTGNQDLLALCWGPIYYHGPHELCISLAALKIQKFYPLKILLLSNYEERVTSLDLLCIDINCKYLLIMELRFDSLLYTLTRVTKILMRAI